MSNYEVTIRRADPGSVPPALYDAKGNVYQANKNDCQVAQNILDQGRRPQAEVTDKNANGKMLRPPHVVRVWDPFATPAAPGRSADEEE